MTAYDVAAWADFANTSAGGAAALAGRHQRHEPSGARTPYATLLPPFPALLIAGGSRCGYTAAAASTG